MSVRLTVMTLHIIAGSLGLLSGFLALSVVKGARLHRKSGRLFVYAMMTMALLGAVMAAVWNVVPVANIPMAMLTAYLVITGLTTVRPLSAGSLTLDIGLMVVVSAVALTLFSFGVQAASSPSGKLHGMPSPPFFVFGVIALLASVGDFRVIRSGGVRAIRGTPRLARHLWRMCTALLIAAFSFFLGQAKVFPKPIRIFPLLVIPPLVVLVALLYWLWRVRVRRALRGTVLVSAPEAA
jgi:uncharacterized membrane protein